MPVRASRRRSVAFRLTAAAIVLLPLAALGASSRGAGHPRTGNPHGRFQEECSHCHTAAAWKPARISRDFDHARFGFPLEGAHAAARCLSCHASLEFGRAQRLCASCHEDPHRGEFGADCARCHRSRSFIDHAGMVRAHQLTRFPLTGGHAGLDCESCHPPAAQGRMQFVNTEVECMTCHANAYRNTASPDHAAAGFPVECQVCHTPVAWNPARFDHARTAFPLSGAHRTALCAGCHGDGIYRGKSTDCVSCHRAEYDRTTDPGHAGAGFPLTCASCHGTTRWTDARFDHAGTRFPLAGAHVAVACAGCHGDGIYRGKSTDCVSCHRADYDGTTGPPHAAAGFALACANCHGTSRWTGAIFDHAATSFPLTGAHVTVACTGCHGDGVYAGKSTECVSCHRADYDRTVDPAHAGAGFPLECASCHTTARWSGATFDHDGPYFPIYSGRHRGTWSTCSTCHTSSSNFTVFTCFSCHPHDDRAGTDQHHAGVAGYRYESSACYSCHPRGGY
jgi:hypothetical protein